MPRPRVTLKFATSLDGRIATADGESRWITGEAARAQGHALRAAHDAILVGIGTALTDDPELTARPADGAAARQPLRVILDTRFRLSIRSKLVHTRDKAPLLVIGGAGNHGATLAAAGVEIAHAPLLDTRPNVAVTLEILAARGVRSVLVEGGGEVAASFVRAGLGDAIEWFRAPVLIGGEGRPCLGGLALQRLKDAPRFKRVAVRDLGPDLWERYVWERECSQGS